VARLSKLLALFLLITLCASAVAQATPEDDATAVANSFVAATYDHDYVTVCSLASVALQGLYSSGYSSCEAPFLAADDPRPAEDQQANSMLLAAWNAAIWYSDHGDGCFISKQFSVKTLAKAMQRTLPALRVVLGKGVASARGQSAKTVVLDSSLTSCHRLVVYVESDSGKIFSVNSGNGPAAQPRVRQVGAGIPVPVVPPAPIAFQATVLEAAVAADGTAFVSLQLTANGQTGTITFRLILENGSYKVDDLLGSLLGS
jgi:hypothetical protein